MKLRATRRSACPPAEAETAHAAGDIDNATNNTRITKRTAIQDKVFSCPKLPLKMHQREAEMDSLLDELEHDPHPSSVMTGQHTHIYLDSILCTQREFSDDGVSDKMKDGLDEAVVLTLKDLKAATISGKMPTAIVDSGASTTCVQPSKEQRQESECVMDTPGTIHSVRQTTSQTRCFRRRTARLHPAKRWFI